MNHEKKKLIEDFLGEERKNSNYERNWIDLMYVAKIICTKLNNFGDKITPHERRLLVDVRQHTRDAILTFERSKVFDCIIDFIDTFNIIKPYK
jgi:hypothetical protein